MICVVDYGMGNLRSVSKALEKVGASVLVSDRASDIRRSKKIVLPGVGEFGQAMKELARRKLIEPIQDAITQQKPFLGICLGLQLLFDSSDESKAVQGLSIFRGRVRQLPRRSHASLKVPQMGWNQVVFTRRSKLTKGVKNKSFFYFVHSYYAIPREEEITLGTTDYGVRFASIIEQKPIFAVQFHPEKSQAAGLQILRNFVRY